MLENLQDCYQERTGASQKQEPLWLVQPAVTHPSSCPANGICESLERFLAYSSSILILEEKNESSAQLMCKQASWASTASREQRQQPFSYELGHLLLHLFTLQLLLQQNLKPRHEAVALGILPVSLRDKHRERMRRKAWEPHRSEIKHASRRTWGERIWLTQGSAAPEPHVARLPLHYVSLVKIK